MKKGDSEGLSDRRPSLHCAIRNLLRITLQVQTPRVGARRSAAGRHTPAPRLLAAAQI